MSQTGSKSVKGGGPRRLVIVESPTKAKTIRRFLPPSYRVEASMGHVRDLPASAAEIPSSYKDQAWARLGINDRFEPIYVVPAKKKKVVSELRAALKDADELFIATDEDREGESIGWHLVEVLNPKVPVRRMVFHEITKDAILRALGETRSIDQHLVGAQETRRVLDRLVGYTLSPLLWKKVAPKLSAGRVQSVAVRLMVMRERERIAFVPASYWDLKAKLEKETRTFDAVMTHLGGVRLASGRDFDDDTGKLKAGLTAGKDILLLGEADAKRLATHLQKEAWRVLKVEERTGKRSPAAPFTTSTLQQEASRKLGLSAKETMRLAQGLYENGYITYMRTDSTNLASEAVEGARKAVASRYGNEYLSPSPRSYTKKTKNAQEAHEAIRPAGREMRTQAEHGLAGLEGRLYDLIWKRTVATQMADAVLRFVTARITVGESEEQAEFRASGRTTVFAGFFRAYVEGSDDPDAALDDQEQPLPELVERDPLSCKALDALGHETKPPARFTEASLVKVLEQEGIGRPSTYASIIDTVVNRGYARKNGSQLVPTFTAFATNNLLEKQFAQLVDTGFTAQMENVLDEIAAGDLAAEPYLERFYRGQEGLEARTQMSLAEVDAKAISTLQFPKWGEYLVRVGRFGPYAEGKVGDETVTTSLPADLAPDEVTREYLHRALTEGNAADNVVGAFPETGEVMVLKSGPYGPYVQLGDDEQEGKPKRISLPKGLEPSAITQDLAAGLLSLPRTLGQHPETGKDVQAAIGRFGPYVKHGSTFASLPKEDDVLAVGLPRALELISKKEFKNKPLRVLGEHPDTGEDVELRDGRYGPYVKHQKTNASLTTQEPDTVTLEEALELLAERERTHPTQKPAARKTSAKKSAVKKTGAKKAGAKPKSARKPIKKSAAPKATPRQLEPYLSDLDPEAAEVVSRLEGMRGGAAQDIATVADGVGLSEEAVRSAHKRGMFKLRMAYGKARKEAAVAA
ncbi:MAG: DNA topoisomerase I [uncultured Truepera sp.]|uniref:DNA topoisomerase 1 n=1 Tax=uncultured Truepera sp. TaxID=543023 RepID=A0A6J4UYH0_9DEIN|nr:MAG: DNA topoisomerase I [uncultured Truepera sp.]